MFTKYLCSLALKGTDRCAVETYPLFPFLCFQFSHFAAQKHFHDNSYGANYEILSLITLMCDLSSNPYCGFRGLDWFSWLERNMLCMYKSKEKVTQIVAYTLPLFPLHH